VKHLKVLGLAMVAAMAVMAFGAGSASATQICLTNQSEGDKKCATATTERELVKNESVVGTAKNPELTNDITDVTCENSSVTGKLTSNNTVTPLTGEITALTFTGNCKTASGTACTVTVKNLPYSGSLTSSALTVQDPVGAGALVKCGFLINCEFLTTKATLGVEHDKFIATGIPLTRNGGFCPEEANWDALYTAPVTIS
jgi:hypothetical protein